MKDKTSQKTEDEVLDQTFGGNQTFDGFDEEMTAQTNENKTGSDTPAKKKSSSNNTILFVALGVAAVGILGYIFVLKPIISPAPIQAKPPQQSVIPEQSPVSPIAPASVPVVTVLPPERQVATDFLTGNSPVQAPSVPVAPVVLAVPVLRTGSVLVTPPVAPLVVPSIAGNVPVVQVINALPVIPEISPSNAPSAETVKELGRKFDLQGQQYRIALDEVGSKVTGLEKFRADQFGINRNVDERLTKLEGGKVVKAPKNLAKPASTSPIVKRSPVKASKSVTEVREPRESRDYRNVIVDKTEDRSPRDTKAKEPSVDYNVHSIYGGRVWLKNSDGSLSTYTSGDKLPSGELIKSVDDEKYLINTDKRSFSKK